MRTSMIWLPVWAVVLAVCASCSSSSNNGFNNPDASSSGDGGSGDGGSGGGGAAMQACAAYAKATCTQANTCSPFTTAVDFGDEVACEQRSILGCTPLFGIHGSSLTPAALSACAQAITGETCVQYLDNHQPSACNFLGTLAAGAACGAGSQCQSGYCKVATGSSCGTCATRTSTCATDGDCPPDQLCSVGQCVTPVSPPGMCNNTSHICVRTLVCLGEQQNDAGLGGCGQAGGVGADCDDPTDCQGGAGIVCDIAQGMCVAALKATTGQMCGIVNGSLVYCTAASVCTNLMKINDAGAPAEGTCHEPAADGAPCGQGVGCTLPAVCSPKTFTCALPDPGSCQ
jgi:hypothetical protein